MYSGMTKKHCYNVMIVCCKRSSIIELGKALSGSIHDMDTFRQYVDDDGKFLKMLIQSFPEPELLGPVNPNVCRAVVGYVAGHVYTLRPA